MASQSNHTCSTRRKSVLFTFSLAAIVLGFSRPATFVSPGLQGASAISDISCKMATHFEGSLFSNATVEDLPSFNLWYLLLAGAMLLWTAQSRFRSNSHQHSNPVGSQSDNLSIDRREVIALTALVSGSVATTLPSEVHAYEFESNRIATYNDKARMLNTAADWYLFDVRPLVFPPLELVSRSSCEEMGNACPEMAALPAIAEMYSIVGAVGAGGVVLSKLERDVFYPMKTLALSSVMDPDTSEELQEIYSKFERNQYKLGKAAKEYELTKVRQLYDEGKLLMNSYFDKVNSTMGLPVNNQFYLVPMPVNNEALENERYWIRRAEKYLVKKKVDAVSKGNKTARFYAKSIFGEDAVSWDPRGDRADELYKPQKKE